MLSIILYVYLIQTSCDVFYREDDRSCMQILCYSCRQDNNQTEATRFCKTCDDELPLCEDCAQSHARRKALQGLKEMHACIDLGQLPNFRILKALNQGYVKICKVEVPHLKTVTVYVIIIMQYKNID